MLATPIAANRTSWPVSRPDTCGEWLPAELPAQRRAAAARRSPGARPSRDDPAQVGDAVATMSTRLSGSSTQSTGTSWMRSPARSASTSSSVSKNQPVSCTSGSSRAATSARIALNPHCASENAGGQRAAQQQVVARAR